MTFEELQKANESISTMQIEKTDKNGVKHSKDYAEVNQRIKAFRMLFPMGTIETQLVSLNDGVCIFRAIVKDEEDAVLGTGTAYEKEGSTFINKTSFIENCETSAVGRALAMCGIGIDTSIASYEEVANAQAQQNAPEMTSEQQKALENADLKAKVIGYVNRHNMGKDKIESICKCYEIESLNQLTTEQCKHYIAVLEKKGGKIDE